MDNNIKKILVLAYTISPYRGSEYSVAWNYVTRMSKENELIVLMGASGDHMGDTRELEAYIEQNPMDNVRFIPIRPSRFINMLNALNRKGIFRYSFYFAYRVWHRKVYKEALKITNNEKIDLIHYLNPIGYREPGLLWKINLPYLWGPIGGANNIPIQLLDALKLKDKVKLIFRAIINSFQIRFKYRVRIALIRTDLLLTATTENQRIFKKIHKKESIYIPENGIVDKVTGKGKLKNKDEKLHFVWIGSIEGRKALIILLDALVLISNRSNFIIDVIGDGPLKQELMNYAKQKEIDDCLIWHGNTPREQVFNKLSMADLNIITSVSEGNPTTIWESMSFGVPTLSLDHCGMHDTICSNCGLLIELGKYNKVVSNLAKELEILSKDSVKLKKLSNGAIECSHKYHWNLREKMFEEFYNRTIENWNLLQEKTK